MLRDGRVYFNSILWYGVRNAQADEVFNDDQERAFSLLCLGERGFELPTESAQ